MGDMEAFHIRLYPYNNINRDSGIKLPEAWMPTIKIHNNRKTLQQRTAEQLLAGTMKQWENRNALITADLCDVNVPCN